MYKVILLPFIAALVAQAIKLATDKVRDNFTWYHIITSYGGMPSSHSAMVAALATAVGLVAGFKSILFGLTIIFAFIVIRDALGFRTYIGHQNKILNKLQEKVSLEPAETLRERVGHTIWEVLAGCALGIGLTLVLHFILP